MAAIALIALACAGEPAAIHAGALGSSIVLVGGRVAVVDRDAGSVSFLDPVTLAKIGTIPVGDEPTALLVVGDRLLVTVKRPGDVVTHDPAAITVAVRAHVCDGPDGIAARLDGQHALVACEWDGTVREIDVATLASTVIASGLVRPRAVVDTDHGALVAEYTRGDVVVLDGKRVISLVPASAPYRPALTKMTANLVAAFASDGARIFVAHELVNHTGDETLEKIADDYGSVSDGNPKINPAVTELVDDGHGGLAVDGAHPPTYARFDGGDFAVTGAAGLAIADSSHVLVANVSSARVVLLDGTEADPGKRATTSFRVGTGPRGIAVDAQMHIAWVDDFLDGAVTRIPLDGGAPLTRALGPNGSPYSADALAGRKLFYDASNTHVTPSGVVACASCHPDGLDDGLVWFVHTPAIALKRRRTPSLANAHTGTAPYHWDGQFDTMDDLTRGTIHDLMAGDGLLVDASTMQKYVDEIVEAPVITAVDADAVARGQALFMSDKTKCATCHAGDAQTDDQFHAPLAPMSLSADDVFSTANTPALHGLALRAPYFHDGRSPDLRDALTRPDASMHGSIATLAPSEIDDLLRYLETL